MIQFPPAVSRTLLRQQLCETCALEHFLIEVLAMQQLEPSLQRQGAALKLVAGALAMVHQHTTHLSALLETFPGGHEEFIRVASAQAGRFLGFVDNQNPDRGCVRMMSENYTLLHQVAMDYTVLHSTGLVLGDAATAGLALMHLREVTPLVMEISELMPTLVFDQLSAEFLGLDPAACEAARANTRHTWETGASSEDTAGPTRLARLFP